MAGNPESHTMRPSDHRVRRKTSPRAIAYRNDPFWIGGRIIVRAARRAYFLSLAP
jgi:hypothetical protein